MARPRKLTDEQRKENARESNEKWKAANRDKVRYTQYKSKAVNFITKKSDLDDLEYLKDIINKRIDGLKSKE